MCDIQATAEQYFSSNNFLSKRILEDITTVRESYEEAWEGLEQKEREQVKSELFYFLEDESFQLSGYQ